MQIRTGALLDLPIQGVSEPAVSALRAIGGPWPAAILHQQCRSDHNSGDFRLDRRRYSWQPHVAPLVRAR